MFASQLESNDDDAFRRVPGARVEGEPEYIYIDFWSRSCGNKLARIVYLLCKTLLVTVWFYFIPFSSIYLSYYIPFKLQQQ